MVKHIVMWNVKENLNKKNVVNELKLRLEALVDTIDPLNSVQVGINYNQSSACRDIVLYTEFDDHAALEAYLIHPAHIEIGGFVKDVTKDRVVTDFVC